MRAFTFSPSRSRLLGPSTITHANNDATCKKKPNPTCSIAGLLWYGGKLSPRQMPIFQSGEVFSWAYWQATCAEAGLLSKQFHIWSPSPARDKEVYCLQLFLCLAPHLLLGKCRFHQQQQKHPPVPIGSNFGTKRSSICTTNNLLARVMPSTSLHRTLAVNVAQSWYQKKGFPISSPPTAPFISFLPQQ